VRAARAVRVFCSNRHLAIGCGRTFSLWTANRIKHLFLCADSCYGPNCGRITRRF
jgi:hypothetical protein